MTPREPGAGPVIERAHYAHAPIHELRLDHDYTGSERAYFKPCGLWYSAPCDDDGWEHWCALERFNIGAYKHVLTVDLSRLLVLRDAIDIDAFSERYRRPDLAPYERHRTIDWPRVAKEYAGIEIAPYQWSRRLDGPEISRWYYSWDCASGCIWDLTAITSWRAVRASRPEREE